MVPTPDNLTETLRRTYPDLTDSQLAGMVDGALLGMDVGTGRLEWLTVAAPAGLNVRNAPNGAIIARLLNGVQVLAQAQDAGWRQVTVRGWVAGEYLE